MTTTTRRRPALALLLAVGTLAVSIPAAAASTVPSSPTSSPTSSPGPTSAGTLDTAPLEQLVAEAADDGVRLSIGVESLDGATLTDGPVVVGSTESFPSASLIKLALVTTVLRQVDRGVLDLDQPVTVHSSDLVAGSGVLNGYGMPYETTLEELGRLTITVSDNSAANLLAETVGLDQVDALASDLGLDTTHMSRLFFSDGPVGEHNVLDTDDTLELLRAVDEGDVLSASSRELLLQWLKDQQIDTKFAVALAGVPLGHKTGDTSSVSHDAGIIFEPGRETALVVLAEDDDGAAQAVADPYVERAATAVYDQLTASPLAPEPSPSATPATTPTTPTTPNTAPATTAPPVVEADQVLPDAGTGDGLPGWLWAALAAASSRSPAVSGASSPWRVAAGSSPRPRTGVRGTTSTGTIAP